MSADSPTSAERARERRAAIFWPAFIVGLLALPVAANVILIRLANNDPSFAVESDYYERALAWDEEMAGRRRDEELGWRLDLQAEPVADGARLVAELRDAAGRSLAGAEVAVEAFAIARAAEPLHQRLTASTPGAYETRMVLEQEGLWELRFQVQWEGQSFSRVERLELRALEASP